MIDREEKDAGENLEDILSEHEQDCGGDKTLETNVKRKLSPLFDFKSVVGIVNFCIVSISFIIGVIIVINIAVNGEDGSQILRKAAPTAAVWAVYAFMAIFRVRLASLLQLILNVHIFAAAFLGTVVDLYTMVSFYDDIMHGLFGFVGSIIALYICCKMTDGVRNFKPIFLIIVIFSIVSAMGSIWEMWEYGFDGLFNQTAQGNKINGVAPYVTDTMWDIIYNSAGCILFIGLYICHYATKKNFLIGSLVEEFSCKVER